MQGSPALSPIGGNWLPTDGRPWVCRFSSEELISDLLWHELSPCWVEHSNKGTHVQPLVRTAPPYPILC